MGSIFIIWNDEVETTPELKFRVEFQSLVLGMHSLCQVDVDLDCLVKHFFSSCSPRLSLLFLIKGWARDPGLLCPHALSTWMGHKDGCRVTMWLQQVHPFSWALTTCWVRGQARFTQSYWEGIEDAGKEAHPQWGGMRAAPRVRWNGQTSGLPPSHTRVPWLACVSVGSPGSVWVS